MTGGGMGWGPKSNTKGGIIDTKEGCIFTMTSQLVFSHAHHKNSQRTNKLSFILPTYSALITSFWGIPPHIGFTISARQKAPYKGIKYQKPYMGLGSVL